MGFTVPEEWLGGAGAVELNIKYKRKNINKYFPAFFFPNEVYRLNYCLQSK